MFLFGSQSHAAELKKKTKKNSVNTTGSPGSVANTSTASAPATPANQRSNSASNHGSAASAGKHKKLTAGDGASGSSPSAGGCGAVSASMMTASQQHQNENFEYGPNGAMLPRSKNTSPTHGQRSGGGGGTFYASASRSRGAYDIDNIVIPYSVAATTRVEILQCKEIPTPK